MFFVHVLLFFKQKTAYEMRISDWSSDVCSSDLTVIDDFAHNPDKVAATLAAVTELPGRALLFFQPHGYGPLRQMGKELAGSFACGMRPEDRLFVCDPVYFGGTVDRSVGSAAPVADIVAGGADAVPVRQGVGWGKEWPVRVD